MKLETDRLILKDYTMGDFNQYYKLKSRKEVWSYSTFTPLENEKQAEDTYRHFLEDSAINQYVFMALYLKKGNLFIGEAGIISFNSSANRCVIGYNLLPEFWSKGYATEITKALVEYAYEVMKTERVEALALVENLASRRVLEKAGLILEGILRNFCRMGMEYKDVCYYGMTSADYQKKYQKEMDKTD